MNPTQDHTMHDDHDCSMPAPREDSATCHQAARVPAAGLAALVTTVRLRNRRRENLAAWAWLLCACGASAALGALLHSAFG